MYILEREQQICSSIEKVWSFISRPENLNDITPDELKFNIVTAVPPIMYNGLIVEYRIKIPFFGTQQWVTEIKHIKEGVSFVDEQRIGPYKFWYHYHELKQNGDNCTMFDRVHYKLPFGIVGKIVHKIFIKKMLNKIFDYRWKKFESFS